MEVRYSHKGKGRHTHCERGLRGVVYEVASEYANEYASGEARGDAEWGGLRG